MIEYQKIYEIDDTVSSVPDTYWHEVGRPENDNKGNSAKITEANYRQSIVNYILNNYDLLIANRYDIEGTLVSSYSIDSTDSYNSYYANVQENQKLAVSIDAPAIVPGKRIKIFYDSTNYGTLPITSTGANIRCRGVLYTTICLFTNGECIELESDGTYWNVVNNWSWRYDDNFISRSDWTNVHAGNIELVVTSSVGYEVYEIVIEATSGYRGIIVGISGNSLFIWFNDDGSGGVGGFFTSGRNITGQSSSTVSALTANTKNVDSYIWHGWDIGYEKISKSFLMSTDGTVGNSQEINTGHMQAGDYACMAMGNDSDSYIQQLGNGGVSISNATGQRSTLTTADYYYKNTIRSKT